MVIRYILKACLFAVLALLIFGFSGTSSETVYEVVYYGEIDNPSNGYFTDIEEAINSVADYGTVYVQKDIFLGEYKVNGITHRQPTIQLDKSIELIGLNNEMPKIIFMSYVDAAFYLNSTEYFKLKDIGAAYLGYDVIEGSSESIEISNGDFFNCNPIYIMAPESNTDIIIKDSTFEDTLITINMKTFSGNLQLINNSFTDTPNSPSSVTLSNVNITAEDNVFNNTTLRLDGDQNISGSITNNEFNDTGGRIYITAPGINLHFNHNKITKNKIEEVYYKGTTPIDFTQNWWGSIYQPDSSRIGGSGEGYIDYSNWSLFEDFSRYKEDPFVIEDLNMAGNELGQASDQDKIKIYDFNGNGIIELLDLIWLGRVVEE